jgi:hypothetical protein
MKLQNLIMLIATVFSILFAASHYVEAKNIICDRDAIRDYASRHCGTSESKKYNFTDYKCYDGSKSECRKDNNWLTESMKVDCANFVSQALIDGGLVFNESFQALEIGKGENAGTKGHTSVYWLLYALLMENCFETITSS